MKFKIQGHGFQALVVVSQVRKLMVTATLRKGGELGLHIHNASHEAKILSHKVKLVGVVLFPGVKVTWDVKVEETKYYRCMQWICCRFKVSTQEFLMLE